MTEDIKLETIKATQELLGKYIKKPVLTEKLLKKPPFRFLHDVITSVTRQTGFLSGLYDAVEMQSENIKDKETKIAFLQKLIDCLKLVTNKNITARPSKIVAGLEPTKTNELLQAIGLALNKKLDSTDAVAQVLSGQVPVKTKTNDQKVEKKQSKKLNEKSDSKEIKESTIANNTTQRIKKSSDAVKVNKKINEEKNSVKHKAPSKTRIEKTKEEIKKEKTVSSRKTDKKDSKTKIKKSETVVENKIQINKVSSQSENNESSLEELKVKTEITEPTTHTSTDIPTEQIIPEVPAVQIEPAEITEIQTSIQNEPESQENVVELKSEKSKTSVRETPTPQVEPEEMVSKKPQQKTDGVIRPKTSLRPPSVRPSSARPGAPRLKDRNDVILPLDELVSLGKVNVIVENVHVQDDDNEETVVVEATSELNFQDVVDAPKTEIPIEKGHLVSQILEQINDDEASSSRPRVEIEWQSEGNKKNRDIANREMERLRESIQTLTRAANPLGKLMNFLQEDVDAMRSELKMWRDANEKLTVDIQSQERLIAESIEPLKVQLNHYDEEIAKQNEQISLTRANVLRNEQKIKMLLTREG